MHRITEKITDQKGEKKEGHYTFNFQPDPVQFMQPAWRGPSPQRIALIHSCPLPPHTLPTMFLASRSSSIHGRSPELVAKFCVSASFHICRFINGAWRPCSSLRIYPLPMPKTSIKSYDHTAQSPGRCLQYSCHAGVRDSQLRQRWWQWGASQECRNLVETTELIVPMAVCRVSGIALFNHEYLEKDSYVPDISDHRATMRLGKHVSMRRTRLVKVIGRHGSVPHGTRYRQSYCGYLLNRSETNTLQHASPVMESSQCLIC